MTTSEVAVNDRWPTFEAAEALSAGNTVTIDSNGKAAKGADDSSVIVGYALTDAASGEQVAVVPARRTFKLSVLVGNPDGTGATDVAVGDELFYRSDGVLSNEADGTGGSSRTIGSETAALALEAVTGTDAVMADVIVIGGVS